MDPDKIASLIDKLTASMSGPARRVWEDAVRQQTITAVAALTLCLAALLLGLVASYLGSRAYRRRTGAPSAWEGDMANSREAAAFFGGGLLAFVAVVVLATLSDTIITGLFNPEWGAIKALAGLVGR